MENADDWKVLLPGIIQLNNEQHIKIGPTDLILDQLLDILLVGVENLKSNFHTPKMTEFDDFEKIIKKEKEKDKQKGQFSYLICKKKNSHLKECNIRGPFEPVFKEKHSEDFVIEILEQEIQTREIENYSEIWIYTTNNPCIMRKTHTPCMYELLHLSVKLSRNYGIKTYIVFSRFYIFSTKMGNILKKCKGFNSNKIGKLPHHLAPEFKFSVEFNQSGFNHELKEFIRKIPKDQKKKFHENKKEIFQSLNKLKQTSTEWRQTLEGTAERLEKEMREKIGDGCDFYDRLESVIINWCNKEVNKAKLLKEEFHNTLKEQVVLHYLEQYRNLEHYPVFFWTDLNESLLDEE